MRVRIVKSWLHLLKGWGWRKECGNCGRVEGKKFYIDCKEYVDHILLCTTCLKELRVKIDALGILVQTGINTK